MAPTGLSIEVSVEGARAIVAVRGEIDVSSVEELRDAVERSLEGAPGELVVDCREVPFVDSSGIRVLLEAGVAAGRAGAAFRVLPSDRVRKVAETLGVAKILGMDPGEA